jgi:hypothetical protein
MSEEGLKQARNLTSNGFFYENLMKMAQLCRQEKDPSRLISAFILHHVFSAMANSLGDRPILKDDLSKLEARYRTTINLSLETAISKTSVEEQTKYLNKLISLFWEDDTLIEPKPN